MKKKVTATILSLCFLAPAALSIAACGGDGGSSSTTSNRVILGNITELSGDFRFSSFDGSSPVASDVDIFKLTNGYATMEMDKNGSYQWNSTAVKSHTETEVVGEDGETDYTITIQLNEGLKLSDGSSVNVDNYLAYILAGSTPVALAAGSPATAGMSYVGYNEFNAYDGTNDSAGNVSKVFTGVRRLSDYSFSLTIDGPDYYPYYFAYTYGSVYCYPVSMILGDGVEIKDDGEGCYLSDSWYASTQSSGTKTYTKAAHLSDARFDTSTYPYSGAYVISSWDKGTNTVTLTLNENFAGNFQGQKPSIQTVVYTKVVSETQFDQLSSGAVDVLSGLTGGDEINAGLALTSGTNARFKETHYERAGYGKIEFDCDFGPTMFTEVRQAISYLLNKTEFASAFTGGYGSLVYGPYSRNLAVYSQAGGSDFEDGLAKYEFSTNAAVKVLEDGGWVYNADGSAYTGSGIRYKKLSAAEAIDYNISYSGATSTGAAYKTVKVGNDYYMPLVINWFSTEANTVSDLLTTYYVGNENITNAGMLITKTEGTFTRLMGEIYRAASYGYSGTPTYGMFNLATGFNSELYDYAYNWSLDERFFAYSVNKLYDAYDYDFAYSDHNSLSYEEAVAQSGGKLGMDYLSMAMVYSVKPGDTEEYAKWWKAYVTRWNELVPEIPLYSNIYYDVYNSKIQGMETTPFRGVAATIVYCTIG